MFGSNSGKKDAQTQIEFDVIMGSSTKISGNIDSEGSIRIDGVLNGDITASGDVIIGSNAEINGNINSNNIEISGLVNGNIHANRTLKIYESGRLNGDFDCSNFHISDGGFFSGNCTVRGESDKPLDDDNLHVNLDADINKSNNASQKNNADSKDDNRTSNDNSKKFKKSLK